MFSVARRVVCNYGPSDWRGACLGADLRREKVWDSSDREATTERRGDSTEKVLLTDLHVTALNACEKLNASKTYCRPMRYR